MSIGDIARLPVAEIAAPDAVLLLWTTNPMLPAALDIGRGRGFAYKTVGFVGVKLTRLGTGWHLGMGHWTRCNPEQCLLFTRGKPKRLSESVWKLIEAPVREHSRKPDEAHERIEALAADPYLKLFARPPLRPGWIAWGSEVPTVGDTAIRPAPICGITNPWDAVAETLEAAPQRQLYRRAYEVTF